MNHRLRIHIYKYLGHVSIFRLDACAYYIRSLLNTNMYTNMRNEQRQRKQSWLSDVMKSPAEDPLEFKYNLDHHTTE